MPVITRASIIQLARDNGVQVREEPYSIDQWRADAQSGRVGDTFACGTAAVLAPIRVGRSRDGNFTISNGESAERTEKLKAALFDIEHCRAEDRYRWVHRVL